MLCGSKCLARNRKKNRESEVEIKMLSWMCGVIRKNRIRCTFIWNSVRVANVDKMLNEGE